MKRLFTNLIIVLAFTVNINSQDFQVSNIGGSYSVGTPVLDVYNNNVYLVMTGNYDFFKFPISGSDLPIITPSIIGSNYAEKVTIGVNKNEGYVYSSLIEHTFTPTSKYQFNFRESRDDAATWPGYNLVDDVQIGNSIAERNDSPILLCSESGVYYNIWFVFNKTDVTSAIMINKLNGDNYRVDHLQGDSDYEKVISADVVTSDNSDEIFLSYCVEENGSNNFYLRRVYFNQVNSLVMDMPILIQSVANSAIDDLDNFTHLLIDSEKSLYFFYNFSDINTNGSDGTYVTKSIDGGTNWSTPVLTFKNDSPWGSTYLDLNITADDKIVLVWSNGSVYVRSSNDGINWTADVPVSSVEAIGNQWQRLDSKVIDNDNIAVTWLDTRTGNEEIFYSNASIPDPDMVLSVDLTINLEGPYNGGEMSTALDDAFVLPITQPFNISPWIYDGTEKTGMLPWNTIVDWVLVELRTEEAASSMVKQTAALVTKNGKIVGWDGLSPLKINYNPGDYYIVVYHRNHLPIMTPDVVHLGP